VRILGKDPKAKAYKLMLDNLDDLWHLYNLLEKHDLVSGVTYRRLDKAEDKLRPEKTEKKRVWLTVEVETVEFHEFSNRLRVLGPIARGPDELGLKSFHTLNFTAGDQLELEKPESWRSHQVEQLKAAVDATKQPKVTIIAIEDDNAVLAQLHQYGIRKVASIQAQGMGKFYSGSTTSKPSKKVSDSKKDFFNDIMLQLQQARTEDTPLIIIGPGFTKDEFVKFCKDKNLPGCERILLETTGQAGMVGVQEAIKRGVVKRLVEDSRVSFETELVEKVLEEISKSGAVSYGLQEITDAVDAGAVESLLVIDHMLREKNELVEELLKQTEENGGKVIIISSVHDAGKQLEALGGMAALLRYKM
jgi:protein pelota